MSVLEVRGLTVEYPGPRGRKFRAVDNVSFDLAAGETLALVGESGSGKSTVVAALGRLVAESSGKILLDGRPAPRRGRRLRGYRKQVQVVFQDPFASLNPSFNVAHHLRRPLLLHGESRATVGAKISELLTSVSLIPAAEVAQKFPHELSGGQRQRVAVARALAPDPVVLLADEPVSMLDVSIRLGILGLLDRLKQDRNLALLYVTHDLATARHFSSRVMVMYRGEIVETGPADEVILRPQHPYSQLLASAAPSRSSRRLTAGRDRGTAAAADATSPTAAAPPAAAAPAAAAERREQETGTGCRFRARCAFAMDICAQHPPDFETAPGHLARCWLFSPEHAQAARA
jgi:peptide/nickel transport system ATP-binding protein